MESIDKCAREIHKIPQNRAKTTKMSPEYRKMVPKMWMICSESVGN